MAVGCAQVCVGGLVGGLVVVVGLGIVVGSAG